MTVGISVATIRVLFLVSAWHFAGLAYIIWHVAYYGFLPIQFFGFVDDTFADFFHTTYWSYHDARYTEWRAVHPPLVFLIGQLISLKECFLFEGLESRDGCGIYSMYVMLAVSLTAAYFNARLFSKKRTVKLLCFVVIITSYPFLFAVERGNYILFAYAFLVFSISAKNKLAEGFFLACAVNIKQYLVVVLGFTVLKRNFRVLISFLISVLILIELAAVYLPARDYLGFIDNMFAFIDDENIGNLWRLPYSSSVAGFISFAKTTDAQYFFDALSETLPYLKTDFIFWYAGSLQFLILVMIVVTGFGLIRLRGQVSEAYIAFGGLVCLLNLSDASGAYAPIVMLAYLPLVLKDLSRKELVALFLLFQPVDSLILDIGQIPNSISFLTGETVTSSLGFTYGSLIRPAAMFFLLLFMALRLTTSKLAVGPAGRRDAGESLPIAA